MSYEMQEQKSAYDSNSLFGKTSLNLFFSLINKDILAGQSVLQISFFFCSEKVSKS